MYFNKKEEEYEMSFLPLQNIFRIFLWMGFNCFKSAEQIREGEGGEGGGVSSVYFRPFLLPDIGSKNSILN